VQTCEPVGAAVSPTDQSCLGGFKGIFVPAQLRHKQEGRAVQSDLPGIPAFLPEGPRFAALEVQGEFLRADAPYLDLSSGEGSLRGFRAILNRSLLIEIC
jgi:hypothetical protein